MKSRDLVEARKLIKLLHETKDRRERLGIFQEIYALLETMPKKSYSSQRRENIFTAIGFGTFMSFVAIPMLLLIGTENSKSIAVALTSSATISYLSTFKIKHGITYAKNMYDNTVGVSKKGKENLKSSGKRDKNNRDLEKYREINLDVDSDKEEQKRIKRKEFINSVIGKINRLIKKEINSLKSTISIEVQRKKEKKRLKEVGKLVEDGYFDISNSLGDFYITESGELEEGFKSFAKKVVITAMILSALNQLGISREQVGSTISRAGGKIIERIDNNVETMRKRNNKIDKNLVITWDSSKNVLKNLSKEILPIAKKLEKTSRPFADSASLGTISNLSLIGSGIIDGMINSNLIASNVKTKLIETSKKLKEIASDLGDTSDRKKVEAVSFSAKLASSELNKASKTIF